jgi:hypothetical protein
MPWTSQWQSVVSPYEGWYACNGSIATDPDGNVKMTVSMRDLKRGDDRHSFEYGPVPGVIRTINAVVDLDEDLGDVMAWIDLPEVELHDHFGPYYGIEDPRLFWDHALNDWCFTGTIYEHHDRKDGAVCFSRLGDPTPVIYPVAEGHTVKNLMPTGHADPMWLDAWAQVQGLRGGACVEVPDRSGYLAVVHVDLGGRYWHHFARFDAMGKLLKRSQVFSFGMNPVEFAAGITIHDEFVVVSYGVQDREVWLAQTPLEKVLKELSW